MYSHQYSTPKHYFNQVRKTEKEGGLCDQLELTNTIHILNE